MRLQPAGHAVRAALLRHLHGARAVRHRFGQLPKTVEEFIYPVMEDFRVDVVLGEGMSARTINLPLKKFTIIGATTRSGMLSGPLRDRFHMHEHLEFYGVEDLAQIVQVNAAKLRTTITPDAAWELARRSRGTPRLANARLRWVRDYATSKADGRVTRNIADAALQMQGIDPLGLDGQDRKYLDIIVKTFHGGPVIGPDMLDLVCDPA